MGRSFSSAIRNPAALMSYPSSRIYSPQLICEQNQQSTEEPKFLCLREAAQRPIHASSSRYTPLNRCSDGRFGLRRFRAKLNPSAFDTYRDRLRPEIRYDVASLKNPAYAVSHFRSTIFPLAMKKSYTDKQGQYLAFIYYYGKIHGRPPSESEMQQYFRVSPPSVHQMSLTLETHGLIERTPGQARSIRLLIPREELPDLV